MALNMVAAAADPAGVADSRQQLDDAARYRREALGPVLRPASGDHGQPGLRLGLSVQTARRRHCAWQSSATCSTASTSSSCRAMTSSVLFAMVFLGVSMIGEIGFTFYLLIRGLNAKAYARPHGLTKALPPGGQSRPATFRSTFPASDPAPPRCGGTPELCLLKGQKMTSNVPMPPPRPSVGPACSIFSFSSSASSAKSPFGPRPSSPAIPKRPPPISSRPAAPFYLSLAADLIGMLLSDVALARLLFGRLPSGVQDAGHGRRRLPSDPVGHSRAEPFAQPVRRFGSGHASAKPCRLHQRTDQCTGAVLPRTAGHRLRSRPVLFRHRLRGSGLADRPVRLCPQGAWLRGCRLGCRLFRRQHLGVPSPWIGRKRSPISTSSR